MSSQMDMMFIQRENIDMDDDFIKHSGETLDLHVKIECEYSHLPLDFIIDEITSAINSKIRSMKVKEISVTQTEIQRIYEETFK